MFVAPVGRYGRHVASEAVSRTERVWDLACPSVGAPRAHRVGRTNEPPAFLLSSPFCKRGAYGVNLRLAVSRRHEDAPLTLPPFLVVPVGLHVGARPYLAGKGEGAGRAAPRASSVGFRSDAASWREKAGAAFATLARKIALVTSISGRSGRPHRSRLSRRWNGAWWWIQARPLPSRRPGPRSNPRFPTADRVILATAREYEVMSWTQGSDLESFRYVEGQAPWAGIPCSGSP
jgi:hypothetical protein